MTEGTSGFFGDGSPRNRLLVAGGAGAYVGAPLCISFRKPSLTAPGVEKVFPLKSILPREIMSISRIAPCAAARSSLAWSAVREKFFHSIAAAPENERLVCPDQIPLVWGNTSRPCSKCIDFEEWGGGDFEEVPGLSLCLPRIRFSPTGSPHRKPAWKACPFLTAPTNGGFEGDPRSQATQQHAWLFKKASESPF
jgi:hypothetical protein